MKKSIITSTLLLALIIAGCSEPKSAQQLIISGNEFANERNFSSAIIEYKNAIRLEPKNAQARFVLANAYLRQGSYLNAEKELTRALELGIDFEDVATQLARVKTGLNKVDEVYQLVERGNDLADRDYIQLLTYAGISGLRQQQVAQAQDYLTQAIAINKDTVYSKLAQAYLYYSSQDYSQALVVINALLEEEIGFPEALLMQGYSHYAQQEFERASEAFARYLTQQPQNHNVRYFEVASLIRAEKYQAANVLTGTLLKTFKDSPLALMYKAQLEYQQQNYTESRDYAEQALQYEQGLLTAKVITGVSSFFLGDTEQAYTKLTAIAGLVPNNHLVKKILAVTKFELGYYGDAAESFVELELTEADITLLKNSSASLMTIGEFEGALTLLDKAEKLAPEDALIAAQKGGILLSRNDIRGIDSIERATKLDPSLTSAQIVLAVEYLKSGQEDKAKEIIHSYQKSKEEAYIGHMLEGFLYLDKKQTEHAINSFEKVIGIQPNNIASLYNLGLMHQELKQEKKAISYFDKVLQLSPEHKGTLRSLVNLAENKEFLADALAVLSKHHQTDSLYMNIALAQVLRSDGQVNQAIGKLKSIDKSVELSSNYFILLGDSYIQLKNFLQARNVFAQGLSIEPSNYFLNVRYISVLEWLGENQLALEQARKAHEFYKNDINITASLFYFEAKNKNYQKAKSLLKILESKNANHHLLDKVAGEVYSVEKNYSQAIDYFSAAYEKSATEVNLLNLARTLKFNGQSKEAEHLLELFIDKHIDNNKIRLLLAELYSNQDRDKKLVQYLVLSSQVPNNAAVLNNLAWNQFKLGQHSQALMNIKKAYQLKPNNLEIQESYGVILVGNDELLEGKNMLDKAIAAGSNDSEVKQSRLKAESLLDKPSAAKG